MTPSSVRPNGPDAPCQRITDKRCAAAGPHLGGVHLDPRHELYDGPGITVLALGGGPGKAAWALLEAGAPVPEVVELVEEIHRLGRQVAAVRVDMDRKVREAMRRADDCEVHGQQLVELSGQAHHFSEQADRDDRARVALLEALWHFRDAVDALRAASKLGRALPSATELVETFGKALEKATAAHDRAWKSRPTGRAPARVQLRLPLSTDPYSVGGEA